MKRIIVISLLVVFVSSCNIDDRSSSKESEEVSEAISLFENEVIRLKDKFNPKNAFYFGNIIPDWTVAQCNYNFERHQINVETRINTTYAYRVVQNYVNAKHARKVPCYQHLLVTYNIEKSTSGVFIVLLIPTSEFDRSHSKGWYKQLDNCGDMKDYSGLKLYCSLDGKLCRVNQYVNGKKKVGFFCANIRNIDLYSLFAGIRFQRGHVLLTKSSMDTELEASYCYGDYPYFPFDDPNFWWWLWNNYGYNEGEYYDPDEGNTNGGGGGGGNGYSGNNSTSLKVGYLSHSSAGFVTGDVLSEANRISTAINNYSSNNPMVAQLCAKLNTSKVLIRVVLYDHEHYENNHYLTYPPDTNGKVIISVPLSGLPDDYPEWDYPTGLLEELFHAYQYQCGDNWDKGDMELEAKIWDYLLYKKYGIGTNVDDPIFWKYYRHQNQQKYFNLIDAWLSANNYDSQLFQRSFNIDHTKHIKQLQSNE